MLYITDAVKPQSQVGNFFYFKHIRRRAVVLYSANNKAAFFSAFYGYKRILENKALTWSYFEFISRFQIYIGKIFLSLHFVKSGYTFEVMRKFVTVYKINYASGIGGRCNSHAYIQAMQQFNRFEHIRFDFENITVKLARASTRFHRARLCRCLTTILPQAFPHVFA